MTARTKVIVSIVALMTAFASGRWATPEKIRTEVKTVEVEKRQEQVKSDLDINRHRETVTTTVKRPDGTVETTTKVTEDTKANKTRDQQTTDEVSKTSDQVKEVTYSQARVTLSALAGWHLGDASPVYGGSVSKPILGPITVGVWALSNATFGASVGLTF